MSAIAVYGLDKVAAMVEETERIKKAEREIRKQRIAEMVAEGVDKEMATIMVDALIIYGF